MKSPGLLIHIVTLSALLAVVPGVSAHRPVWGDPDGVTELQNITTSFAFYRELTTSSQVDIYAFEARASDHLHAGINIPAMGGFESYGVSVALFGPGLPRAEHNLLPPEHPEDLGALVFSSVPGKDFFEPFTQTSYWGRQRLDLSLPETGTYYLAVWNPEGVPGKYVMDTGTAEVFSLLDLFAFPLWWVQVHLFFDQGPQIIAVLLIGFAGLGGAAAAIGRTRRFAPPRVTMSGVQ